MKNMTHYFEACLYQMRKVDSNTAKQKSILLWPSAIISPRTVPYHKNSKNLL